MKKAYYPSVGTRVIIEHDSEHAVSGAPKEELIEDAKAVMAKTFCMGAIDDLADYIERSTGAKDVRWAIEMWFDDYVFKLEEYRAHRDGCK